MPRTIFIIFLFFCSFNFALTQQKTTAEIMQEIAENAKLIDAGEYEKGLTNLKHILKYSREKKNHEGELVANINLGLLYYRLSDFDMALNYYFKALDLAKDYKLTAHFSSIYNNIGIVYSTNNNFEKAKGYFLNALDVNIELKDTIRIGINNLNLANLLLDYNKYQEAQEFVDEAEKIFLVVNQPNLLIALYNIKGNILFKEQRFILAKENQLKALSYLKKYNDVQYETNVNIELGRAYYKLNHYDSAAYFTSIGLELAREQGLKDLIISSSELLADIHLSKNMYLESIYSLREGLAWKDSILAEKSQKWVSEAQMRYEFGKKEQEVTFLERRNHLYLIIGILSFLFVIITGIFLIYYFRSRQIKAQQRNDLLIKEKEVNKLELEKSEAENRCLVEEMKANEEKNQLKQEQLQRELEHKNRELASNAMHVVNKNSILSNIKVLVHSIPYKEDRGVENKIKSISELIESNINFDNDWDTFKLHFEEVHGDFFHNVKEKHPDLNQGDLRLCAYILINLNAKEIAQILYISPDSIRKRKQRLREKLEIDKDIDLFDYLNTLK